MHKTLALVILKRWHENNVLFPVLVNRTLKHVPKKYFTFFIFRFYLIFQFQLNFPLSKLLQYFHVRLHDAHFFVLEHTLASLWTVHFRFFHIFF